MFYYTYVLISSKDYKFYIGSTSNLKDRIKIHNQGRVKSTKGRRPLKLIYYEACLKKQKAENREKYFKTGFGRGFLKVELRIVRGPLAQLVEHLPLKEQVQGSSPWWLTLIFLINLT